jgi:SAM-dependent methyltransferase
MAEFTGERVVPGQVDPDLWNEHLARYAFAGRLCRHKRILDMGCGTGYGTAELARHALTATGIDVATSAVEHAREHFTARNLRYLRASCTQLPFPDASFDLAVSFEVIEHIPEWRRLIEEARRVLKPGGQFIVSTPNRLYYAESRKLAGPNPYHDHEFEFEEFRTELESVFPSVSLFLQNHAAGIVFQPIHPDESADVSIAGQDITPDESHFFLAVCALGPQLGAPTFVYLPTTANLLRERELHITRLEREIETKNAWLQQARSQHAELLDSHRAIQAEIEQKNNWADEINAEVAAARESCAAMKAEVEAKNLWAAKINAEIDDARETCAALQAELEARNRWAAELNAELNDRGERIIELQEELRQNNHWTEQLKLELSQREQRIVQLQEEVESGNENSKQLAAAYEAELRRVEQEMSQLVHWARDRETELTSQLEATLEHLAGRDKEFARCLELYHDTEKVVLERTNWAQSLDAELKDTRSLLERATSAVADSKSEIENYRAQVDMARSSRWLKIGNALGVGPKLTER